jgi:hypothetical protein
VFGAPHQAGQQLSRKVCNFDQPRPAHIVEYSQCVESVESIRMFNYPGRETILCIDDDDGMLRYKKRCSKDVDIRCSPPPLPDKG